MKGAALGLAGLVLAGVLPANAQETCVVCKVPDATYRCAVEKAEKLERFGRGAERAIDLACAKELARQGGHASCSVRREAPGTACAGSLRTLSIANVLAALSSAEPAAPASPVAAPAAQAEVKPAEPKAGPPRTVQELAERTSETSKQQLKQAGTAVGGAMEKTWDCLSSLFKRC